MNFRDCFDLSQPVTFGVPKQEAAGGQSPTSAAPPTPGQQVSLAWQIAICFILLGSILASRFLDLYRAGVPGTFGVDWKYLLFIAIASLLAFPLVYDKARLNREQPVFLQIVLIFSAGMGWEKIVATATGR